MNILKSRKALNFDLYDYLLKINYPSKNYKKGWTDIKSYLKINALYIDNIQLCIKEFDVTIVGDEYSLLDYIHQDREF